MSHDGPFLATRRGAHAQTTRRRAPLTAARAAACAGRPRSPACQRARRAAARRQGACRAPWPTAAAAAQRAATHLHWRAPRPRAPARVPRPVKLPLPPPTPPLPTPAGWSPYLLGEWQSKTGGNTFGELIPSTAFPRPQFQSYTPPLHSLPRATQSRIPSLSLYILLKTVAEHPLHCTGVDRS